MHPPLWFIQEGDHIPLVATAIHDGHAARDEVTNLFALDDASRLREEDPHTGTWARIADTWIVANRSRFEVDLNRPREKAIYRIPADAWGLHIWQSELPQAIISRSLNEYDDFYAQVRQLFTRLERRFSRFVVLDLHTYCHRRDGADAPPANPLDNPDVNIGTGTMLNRNQWSPVVDRFMEDLRRIAVQGHLLDVRENVKFRGGHFAAWVHTTFPQTACVLSIEFKKFFMDEWSGSTDEKQVEAIRRALESTIPGILAGLTQVTS
jgi:hypothetical protein